jgi:hypothetical protein
LHCSPSRSVRSLPERSAALLAGVLAGMAAASIVVWLEIAALERRLGGVLFGERGLERLYLDVV